MEKNNLIIFIALSAAILFGWQFLYVAPQVEQQQQEIAEQAQTPGQAGQTLEQPAQGPNLGVELPGAATEAEQERLSREQALSARPRIEIQSSRLTGSISLKGARLDDLTLLAYRETVDRDSPNIVLLEPTGSTQPYYAEFGWIGEGTTLPDSETVWTADGDTLTPGVPLTLSWTSPEGVTFEQIYTLDDFYLFSVTQRVRNDSEGLVSVAPYGLVSRTGTPDVLGFYILHEGLLGVFDETLSEIDYDELREVGRIRNDTTGGWLGITDKYWLVALLPDQGVPLKTSFSAGSRGATDKYQADFLAPAVSIPAGGEKEMTNRLFSGAKIVRLLDDYERIYGIQRFDLAVDFGWFYFLTKPIFYAIDWFNDQLGNFGLAILALTVCIKLLFFPLANKSYKSMSKMKKLQPIMQEMKEKYGDDRQRLNQEMMELYKKEKVNPLSGCLPILIQIPVFFALYKVLFVTIEMRHAPFYGWIHDLSAPDPLGMLTLFGLVDWRVPAILAVVNIGIWPIIMGATMYVQQRLNPAPPDPVQAKIFMFLPLFFTFLLAGFPAGLVIYWAWNNLLSVIQQWVIMSRMGVKVSLFSRGT